MDIMNRLCQWLVDKYPNRSRIICRNGQPYLLRFYITKPHLDRNKTPDPEPFGIYLHHFYRGDEDPELHNHPWRWALSLILSGAYVEEREEGDHLRSAGKFNFIRYDTFHRVTLKEPVLKPVWTLFTVGPRVSSWGFKNKHTGEFWDWKAYLRLRGESIL